MKKERKIFVCRVIVVGCIVLLTNACKKKESKEDSTPTPVPTPVSVAIGDSYNGGKVAYILLSGDAGYDANVQHGIIAATSDQSPSMQYGAVAVTGATDTTIGGGTINTNLIVTSYGTSINSAAKLCSDLVLEGYSDWYLPSKNELSKLYLNRVAIGGFVTNSGYWSSSEGDVTNAWLQSFNLGTKILTYKPSLAHVRAIRSF